MKSEIYNALASLNRGIDATMESLKVLQEEGVVAIEYVQAQTEAIEEIRAGLNTVILNKLGTREVPDREHFGKMRMDTGERLKAV